MSLNLRPLEVRRGLRAQTCAFWNRFLPKLLSATGRRGVGVKGRELMRRQGLEGGKSKGMQRQGVIPSLLHLPQPRRLPASAQAPPMGRLPRGPGPTYSCPLSFSSFSSSTPGFRGCDYSLFSPLASEDTYSSMWLEGKEGPLLGIQHPTPFSSRDKLDKVSLSENPKTSFLFLI